MGRREANPIELSENERLDYRNGIPLSIFLARDIAATANSNGGKILIRGTTGTSGDLRVVGGLNTDGSILMLDSTGIDERINAALAYLHPQPHISHSFQKIAGNNVYVIEIFPSSVPIIRNDGRYYVRRGMVISQIGEELLEALADAAPSIKSNILHSFGSKEGDIEAAKNNNDFTEIVREKIEATPDIKLDESLMEWIERTRADVLLMT